MMTTTILAAALGVADVLGGYRQLQGNDREHGAYTEVHDAVMNRVMERDRAVDAEWQEAARDAAVFKRKQSATRQAWIDSMGGFPERCPLNVKVTGVFHRDGYRVEKTMFESRPNHHVTATVYVPENAKFKAPYPAVAVACGHSFEGKMTRNYQRPGVIGARNGFVVAIYDPIDQGERHQRRDKYWRTSTTVTGHNNVGYRAMLLGWNCGQFRVWDGMRTIDMLCARPDVDGTRIAVTGHSGGGTESSYLMALDDRVAAACPSGFITSMRELAYLCGPQDAEQKFFGQLAYGLNHLGILMLRADRCAEMPLTTHADFFPFMGATDTRDCARRAFASLGRSDAFDFIHASGPHLWPESSQQAEFRWFRKWLKGEDAWHGYDAVEAQKINFGFSYDDPAVDFGAFREKDNLVTATGHVVDLPGERTVYDIMRDEASRCARSRGTLDAATVGRVAGIAVDGLGHEVLDRCETDLGTAKAVVSTLYRADGTPLTLYVFKPGKAVDVDPLLLVSDTLQSSNLASRVEAALAEGRAVAVAELRAFGRTGRDVRRHGETRDGRFYGCPSSDEMTATMMEWLGESMVGKRAEDLLVAAEAAGGEIGGGRLFALEAVGRAAVPAAHAYFVGRRRFASFATRNAPPSWGELLKNELLPYRFADVVHGAYRHYDWTDLAR